jgi:hypothetical protein
MPPKVGGVYKTRGGRVVGPLKPYDFNSIWPYIYYHPLEEQYIYFNKEGIAEEDLPVRRPEYDLILEEEELKPEDFL